MRAAAKSFRCRRSMPTDGIPVLLETAVSLLPLAPANRRGFFSLFGKSSVHVYIRTLHNVDRKRYMDLRAHAASENPFARCREADRELLMLADGPRQLLATHQAQGTQVWGVHDVGMVGTIAVSRRYNPEIGDHLCVWGFYVLPRYRGTPASGLLMTAALDWVAAQKEELRLLSSFKKLDHHSRHYLERWGFRRSVNTRHWVGADAVPVGHVVVERD